ncbi:MAG: type II toxin-antitoxin system PemK/MazF family toxin [Pseudobutyrivibrio sp.]|nr:type II toxin-antitoxin system PemK/MazF family toxin [Pseudobutyrivibrio sp.]
MKEHFFQGDILKIEKIKVPVLVVSKNYFNESGEIIGCPIYEDGELGPLHIRISDEEDGGIVHCEKMKLFDLRVRGCTKVGNISINAIMDITDTIQGICDYV